MVRLGGTPRGDLPAEVEAIAFKDAYVVAVDSERNLLVAIESGKHGLPINERRVAANRDDERDMGLLQPTIAGGLVFDCVPSRFDARAEPHAHREVCRHDAFAVPRRRVHGGSEHSVAEREFELVLGTRKSSYRPPHGG